MTRRLDESLAWAADGAAHLRGLMSRLADEAFAAPCALPGWSRAHLLTHIARSADGMVNLLTWARTGVETPAYASPEQREADIAAGAARTPAEIRTDVEGASDRLAGAARAMPKEAWSAMVRIRQADVPASDIPWARAREMWIHAVDLDVGASLSDMPTPMLVELIGEAVGVVGAREGCPPLRLVAKDSVSTWELAGGDGADVTGTTAELAAWLLGRSRGKVLRTADGRKPPVLPAYL